MLPQRCRKNVPTCSIKFDHGRLRHIGQVVVDGADSHGDTLLPKRFDDVIDTAFEDMTLVLAEKPAVFAAALPVCHGDYRKNAKPRTARTPCLAIGSDQKPF